MTESVPAILADPDWLPHTFDRSGALLDFVRLSAADRDSLAFLAEEYVGKDFAHQVLGYDKVRAATPAADAAPVHFIFHTSFCCSTLLARALAAGGGARVLREPDILMNLAQRLLRQPGPANIERLEVVLRLLSRPVPAGGTAVIVKPSNFANNLIGPMLKARPAARAVLIHSDLDAFLRAIAKKGMWGRIWVRKLFLQLGAWTDLDFGFGETERFVLSDLQAAGLCWLMQARHFRRLAEHHGPERLVLVHSDDLIARPEAVLERASALFALGWTEAQVRRAAGEDIFNRHSKSAERFGADRRAQEHERTLAAHGEEMAMVRQWVEAVAARFDTPLALTDLDAAV
ncbi:hypothetical protein [Sphingosinicella sp. CPCC 101087]|uniref:hypothetical protein n=1 Tax=Sphingosinicella sp. CPCC 101087 TaxID=2497754 RepID=UPI00101CE9A0|nr:hypothetical protein [Sphingosinicella sp. CPCC 101087]